MAKVTPKEMLDLIINRKHFRILWLADVVSHLGDWLSMVALAVLVTQESGSGLALALLFIIHTIPQAIAAPVAGRLADYFERRSVLFWTHIIRAGITAAMVLAASHREIEILQGLLFARVLVGTAAEPAARAALPHLVSKDQIRSATALQSFTWSVLFTIGMALGGVLSGTFGPILALGIDAATFLVAGLLVLGLPKIQPGEQLNGKKGVRGNITGLMVAWRYAKNNPTAEAVVGIGASST